MSARTVDPGFWHALRVWWAFTWRLPVLILIPFSPIAVAVFLLKPSPDAAMRVIGWAAWPMVVFALDRERGDAGVLDE